MQQGKQAPVFAYPRLSKTDLLFIRIGGDGLGNLLFKWARYLAASERHGWRMIWPTWPSFKPKNWRVNPYDHRTYSDLFTPTARYVNGPVQHRGRDCPGVCVSGQRRRCPHHWF